MSATTYTHYDPLGRVTGSRQDTAGQAYDFLYTYNDLALEMETYPSRRVVESCYDAAGRMQSLLNVTQAGPAPYVSGVQYDPAAGIKQMTTGNNIVETRTYNSRLQVAEIKAGSLLTLDYNYGTTANNGNLLSQTIARAANGTSQVWAQSYGYTDGLNRLTGATETGAGSWSRSFGYDPRANGWVTGSATITPSSFAPVASTNFDGSNRLQMQGAGYGGAGNQTAIGSYAMQYDAENRMRQSTLGSGQTAYVYDGDGRRVQKVTGSRTTFVYDALGQVAAEYGGANATAGTSYVTADHLGSARLMTDAGGNAVRCYDYLPYREEIPGGVAGRTGSCFTPSGTEPVQTRFTGQYQDAETGSSAAPGGLDFFEARYLSGAQGRFASPDPSFESTILELPHAWNMYGYVGNNPLAYVDPSGLDGEPTFTATGTAFKWWQFWCYSGGGSGSDGSGDSGDSGCILCGIGGYFSTTVHAAPHPPQQPPPQKPAPKQQQVRSANHAASLHRLFRSHGRRSGYQSDVHHVVSVARKLLESCQRRSPVLRDPRQMQVDLKDSVRAPPVFCHPRSLSGAHALKAVA